MEEEMTEARLFDEAEKQAISTAACTKSRWLGIPYAIEGKITNRAKESTNGQIHFRLFDKEGSIIGEAGDSCDNILPNETWHYKALITVDGCASFELVGLHW